MEKEYKAGFVAIVGAANVGKSTLFNKIAGRRLAFVNDKPQSTIRPLSAVVTTDSEQIIYTDTPGLHKPMNRLDNFMQEETEHCMKNADINILVVDCTKDVGSNDLDAVKKIKNYPAPAILVINKTELITEKKLFQIISQYTNLYDFDSIVPVSAKTGKGVDQLIEEVKQYIKVRPRYYPPETISDRSEERLVTDVIRGRLFNNMNYEVPHAVAVKVVKLKKTPTRLRVAAVLWCEKESHKKILVGTNGEKIKELEIKVRREIETIFKKKVSVNLWVKVMHNWRKNEEKLKELGFSHKTQIMQLPDAQ